MGAVFKWAPRDITVQRDIVVRDDVAGLAAVKPVRPEVTHYVVYAALLPPWIDESP